MLVDLIKEVAVRPAFFVHSCGRRYVQGLDWSVAELPCVDLASLGYTPTKLQALTRTYYNAPEVAKAKAKLAERRGEKHSSVAILTRNQEKTHPKTQGWCIQGIVVSESWCGRQHTVTAPTAKKGATNGIE